MRQRYNPMKLALSPALSSRHPHLLILYFFCCCCCSLTIQQGSSTPERRVLLDVEPCPPLPVAVTPARRAPVPNVRPPPPPPASEPLAVAQQRLLSVGQDPKHMANFDVVTNVTVTYDSCLASLQVSPEDEGGGGGGGEEEENDNRKMW